MQTVTITLMEYELEKIIESIDFYLVKHNCRFLNDTKKDLIEQVKVLNPFFSIKLTQGGTK